MLVAVSVLLMYVETSFQLLVVLTSHSLPVYRVPVALITLTLTLAAFTITTVTSVALTLRLQDFRKNLRSTLLFASSHACGAGLLWRAFRLELIFSAQDLKHLNALRLVHVCLQSSVYVTLYARLFTVGSKINAIQTASLIVSTLSSAIALTSFSLGKQLSACACEDGHSSDKLSSIRRCVYLLLGFVGTTLVYGVRLVSIALMASRQGLWVFLPLLFHFSVMFIVYSCRHSQEWKSGHKPLWMQAILYAGLAWLSVLDLGHDKTPSVTCKNVSLSSLFLVENIVMLSIWLLDSSLASAGKLFIFVGIITVFIVGLIAKFAVYASLAEMRSESSDSESVSYCNMNTTTSSLAGCDTRDGRNPRSWKHQSLESCEDLISIIQAAAVRGGSKSKTSREIEKSLNSKYASLKTRQSYDETSFHCEASQGSQTVTLAGSYCSQSQCEAQSPYPNVTNPTSYDGEIELKPRHRIATLDSHCLRGWERSLLQKQIYRTSLLEQNTCKGRNIQEVLLDPREMRSNQMDTPQQAIPLFPHSVPQTAAYKPNNRNLNRQKDGMRARRLPQPDTGQSSEPNLQRKRFQKSHGHQRTRSTNFEVFAVNMSSSNSFPDDIAFSDLTQSSLPETETETGVSRQDSGSSRSSRSSSLTITTTSSSSTTTVYTHRPRRLDIRLAVNSRSIPTSERILHWLSDTEGGQLRHSSLTISHLRSTSSKSSATC
ncbi:XK-related protein [Elysia marginata]|uniref:XK-related protein n=1 Tax=Elysia marginata TaxID=1093978 RepID=A0AAV4F603_9GAST|nr:XK-related protein [Elysia marginata]